MHETPPHPDPSPIVTMASAYYDSCVLFAGIETGLFDALSERPEAPSDEIAARLGLHPAKMPLLLNACAALGLLEKDGDRYRNAAATEAFLVSGRPGDLSGAIRYNRDMYPLWIRLPEMLRTGAPVERPETHLGDDPERTRTFVMAMHGRAMGIGRAVIPRLELKGNERILDVGGGSGAFSILAAQAHPDVRARLIELPAVRAIAEEQVARAGLQDRIDCLAGDYRRDPLPGGHDVVFLFGMLHQEAPDFIRNLLARAFSALNPGGRLFVLDMMTDASRCRPKFSALFALNMALTAEHGWVFSEEDLRAWCEEAGFADFRRSVLPPPMPHWLAAVRKPAAP